MDEAIAKYEPRIVFWFVAHLGGARDIRY